MPGLMGLSLEKQGEKGLDAEGERREAFGRRKGTWRNQHKRQRWRRHQQDIGKSLDLKCVNCPHCNYPVYQQSYSILELFVGNKTGGAGCGAGGQMGKGLCFTPALTGREQNSVYLQKHKSTGDRKKYKVSYRSLQKMGGEFLTIPGCGTVVQ